MLVQQGNNSWIGRLLILAMGMAVLLGVTLSSTDVLNPSTNSANADATRWAAAGQATTSAQSGLWAATREAAQMQAETTRTALDAAHAAFMIKATQTAVVIAPTQTAEADQAKNRLAEISAQREGNIQSIFAAAAAGAIIIFALGFVVVLVYKVVINQRTRAAEALSHMYEHEAEVLKEIRRGTQLASSKGLAPEQRAALLNSLHIVHGRNGHDRDEVDDTKLAA
jgi:flagellar biosynthesis/type III secretory pathway M-ring protein FliF/YscJ